ncbi:histidine utilization repressor [Chelatococcus sp. SYSU_G07232]|uniref:Histidine utilization repressor n=1 Tax=Chelatococcus albus TaxID=3047466 RepID=A0ABT7AI87_9HYPH|nr:histidine utilization repressor [Chelatococcus sp. SYSU_G07232]MDJ1159073.1 histidine utilization repressor [Chelatococcus sp. SYSU_G07232]
MTTTDDILPRYVEIQRELEARIMSGAWPPGHRVPSEHELVELYGCSRMTVNKALSALANAGLILRRRRSGSFVASPKSQETVLEIHDIKAEILGTGKAYRFEILAREARRAGPEDAEHLGVAPDTQVLALTVRHFAAERPFVVEERLINLATVPAAKAEPFAAAPPGTWLLDRIAWTDAEHAIRAVSANAQTAARLDMARGGACLVVERRTWQAGEAITWVRLTYPGDRHRLVGRFNPGGLRPGAREGTKGA